MNVCEFTLYEYSWKRGERIPRDITCIYSRVFYRQVSVHVSVHAAKKRRKKKKTSESSRQIDRASILRAKRILSRGERRGIDFSARESAWYARRRAINAICIQNEIVVYQNPSFTFHGGRAEKRGGRAIAAVPLLLPPPLYGNLIIYPV